MPVSPDERARIAETDWAQFDDRFRGLSLFRRRGGTDVITRDDERRCIFLTEDNLCLIHRERGMQVKPIGCQLFPFEFIRTGDTVWVDVSWAATGVVREGGIAPAADDPEVQRLLELAEATGQVREVTDSASIDLIAELQALVTERKDDAVDVAVAAVKAGLDFLAGQTGATPADVLEHARTAPVPDFDAPGPMPPAGRIQVIQFITTTAQSFGARGLGGWAKTALAQARNLSSGTLTHPDIPAPVPLAEIGKVGWPEDDAQRDLWRRFLQHNIRDTLLTDRFDPNVASAELVTRFGFARWLAKMLAAHHRRPEVGPEDMEWALTETSAFLERYHRQKIDQLFSRTAGQFQNLYAHPAFLARYLRAQP